MTELERVLNAIAYEFMRLATAAENIAVEMARFNEAQRDSVSSEEGADDD